LEAVVAVLTAALLTLFDLDRTFYVPRAVPRKAALRLWWWSFIFTVSSALRDSKDGHLRSSRSISPIRQRNPDCRVQRSVTEVEY